MNKDEIQKQHLSNLSIATFEFEDNVIHYYNNYTVLDSGSVISALGIEYFNACGWLSIATALKLLYQMDKLGIHFKRIHRLYESDDNPLSAQSLRNICLGNLYGQRAPHKTIELDEEISEDDLRLLCDIYNLYIIIHYFSDQGDGIDTYGNKLGLEIHLVIYKKHYCVPINGISVPRDFITNNIRVRKLDEYDIAKKIGLMSRIGIDEEDIKYNLQMFEDKLLSEDSDIDIGWELHWSIEISDEMEAKIKSEVRDFVDSLIRKSQAECSIVNVHK